MDDVLQIPRHEKILEAYSDISFAPEGNRSYQGVIVLFAGSPVQWEANRQSFCTLSTAESELMAAIEAMVMSQSVEAIVKVMGDGSTLEKVIYTDNSSVISILEKPDGPWRTRHLRLRANYLRERLRFQSDEWKVRHQKGSTLIADLLTKAVTQVSSWLRFWKFLDFAISSPEPLDDDGGEAFKDEENPESDQVDGELSPEMTTKIAKVGMLMGLVSKLPSDSFVGCLRWVLLLVLSVVLMVWAKLTKRPGQILKNETCQLARVNNLANWSVEMMWKDDKKKKENEKRMEDKMARENEPAAMEEIDRADEPSISIGLREDEPRPILEVKCGRTGRAIFETHSVGRPAVGFAGDGRLLSVDPEVNLTLRNPVSTVDGSKDYHCPTGCPVVSLGSPASAAMDVRVGGVKPKMAALRCQAPDGKNSLSDLSESEVWNFERFFLPT